MIVVTAGAKYLDIDAYACSIAYAELLQLLGKDAAAVSTTAVLNESIPPSLRDLPASLQRQYQPDPEDVFVIVDISDPEHIDHIVDVNRVVEVYDHHLGFEEYWSKKPRTMRHIEFIGSAATLIFEQWQKAGLLEKMSPVSSTLLAAAILDNTLNFGAGVTTSRDKTAYKFLTQHANLDDDWASSYFSECQQTIAINLAQSLRNDTKFLSFDNFPSTLCVGQLAVWDAEELIKTKSDVINKELSSIQDKWFANIVSISQNCSYFVTSDETIKKWLEQTLKITFNERVAKANQMWLRKEIVKVAQTTRA